jgi:hypothetical protein
MNSDDYQFYLLAGYSFNSGNKLRIDEIEMYKSIALMEQKPKGQMSKTHIDDISAYFNTIKRNKGGAALTPYGIIVSGGKNAAGTTASATQVYWPHVVADMTEQAVGLFGEYYAYDAALGGTPDRAALFEGTTPVATRVDPEINFDWGTGAPFSVTGDYFATRWTGYLLPQYTETYTFYEYSDDGVRLWVDGELVIDKWTQEGVVEYTGTKSLVAGTMVPIVLEYYEYGGDAAVQLSWSSTSVAKAIIPPDAFKVSLSYGKYGISRELPNMISSRADHCLVYHKGFLYRVGGDTGGGTVSRFDFSTNSWGADFVPDSNTTAFKRTKAAACSFGDEIFVFGGYDGSSTTNTAFAWNPETDKVRSLATIPNTGGGTYTRKMSAVPYGPHIYLIGGAKDSGSAARGSIIRYTP